MKKTLLSLAFLLLAVPASAQVIQVHDLNWYGLQDVWPEPAEIDGNPATLEFVLVGVDKIELMNPNKLIEGRLCREDVKNPLHAVYGEATLVTVQAIRTINGRTFIMTWGFDLVTGQTPYDLRPAQFEVCR